MSQILGSLAVPVQWFHFACKVQKNPRVFDPRLKLNRGSEPPPIQDPTGKNQQELEPTDKASVEDSAFKRNLIRQFFKTQERQAST